MALMQSLACWEAVFLFRGPGCRPRVPVVMGEVFGLGLARVVYLHGRHGASVVGAVLEGGSVVPGVEGMVGVEVGVADGALQHSAKSCTWGLAGYIVGGRPVLVGVFHYSGPASHVNLLSVGYSTICHRSVEGAGEFNLKNEAGRMTGGGG